MIRTLFQRSLTSKKLMSNRNINLITPYFVPSFSSINDQLYVNKIINLLRNVPQKCILLSAYDYNRYNIARKRKLFSEELLTDTFKDRLFYLDSGGYELRKKGRKRSYNFDDYVRIIDILKPDIFVSFDKDITLSFEDSIKLNKILFEANYDKLRTQIYHFERDKTGSNYQDLENMLMKYDGMFDILGLIDSELGSSLSQRVSNLKNIKEIILKNGLNLAIHIFGCSDLLSIYHYYHNGADIFDGLGWYKRLYDFRTLRSSAKPNISVLKCNCSICKNVNWDSIAYAELENVVYLHNLIGFLEYFESIDEIR